ncbi:hypothetical protein RQP46_006910 [Phenoliferia psychrophenolica]
MGRRKSLLIGINYIGSKNQLSGCINDVKNVRKYLVENRGFPTETMVILTDDQTNPQFIPTGANMIAAFHWLISGNQPGDSLFLHYSGHGGQVADPDGDRESGFDASLSTSESRSTFTNGQIDSDKLHKMLVTPLLPGVRLTIIFSLQDNVKKGVQLASMASHLMQGGFNMSKVNEAKQLLAGATSLFNSFKHRHDPQQPDGLGEEKFAEDWESEKRDVWMFSGCKDDQTSADSSFAGQAAGAMSYAFITTMNQNAQQSYLQVLQSTRGLLQDKYSQIPQLSVGDKVDINQIVSF